MKNSTDYLNGLQITNTKNFENNIIKTLPEGVEKVYLSSCGIRKVGTGSYNYFLDLDINGESITLKKFTHSSPDYDYYTDLEFGTRNFENWLKKTALSVIEHNEDTIIELIEDLKE
jgi:hypothetical protein